MLTRPLLHPTRSLLRLLWKTLTLGHPLVLHALKLYGLNAILISDFFFSIINLAFVHRFPHVILRILLLFEIMLLRLHHLLRFDFSHLTFVSFGSLLVALWIVTGVELSVLSLFGDGGARPNDNGLLLLLIRVLWSLFGFTNYIFVFSIASIYPSV